MSARSIGKFLPSLKLRLGTKAVVCAIFLIAVNTALVVGAAYWSLTSEFGDRALREIDVNLRTLALTFSETVPDAKITLKDGVVAKAEIPRMPEFKDHAIVDRAVGYAGGNATLFPGGVVRAGSKLGSKYAALSASTNDAFCPGLFGLVDRSALTEQIGCVQATVPSAPSWRLIIPGRRSCVGERPTRARRYCSASRT